ncbi:2-phospho-L-lactate guanylyltransferase [Actinokineospora xionganensis]|uniref:2-phospho-L-lactate guanylyltransferase n=1 Tax=Actinokineospora xionganensis TaxID=2684470 RepID=UPI0028AFAE34|nr:2-phospho-L-lactate guanylyltransferase [Actinokineospora xionganensis]
MVDLVVPVKHLDRAKTRLRGTVPGGPGGHLELVLALLVDTLVAAVAAPGVRRVLVVCEDERVTEAVAATGAECVDERGLPGLNAALRFGADVLLTDDPDTTVGALQADLPALRPADLGAAISRAAGARAFVADREGTGTTLLIAAAGTSLAPRFGAGSALAHGRTALMVGAGLATLRCDVDTAADLTEALALGVGPRTSEVVQGIRKVC